ncbi:hypothetical protein GCM10010168_70790 [Actinoplanes ianthinogenes]|uniref:DUF1707 domain-containing protein n=1 Tax=Actinoplanes ianthinogenes TaxID=122358 RepID=A0ABN6CQ83_9ACTN|nr:hypothetical protein [Actinoplanes ianthinogenes]BCJ47332.1 hypothetical protein Aiant_79890 [Actinoplanes ianthinogenes]GGR41970.1 hypothetical protein GCM10010168_70790 [Actinoplanes ianthinogenes]
MTPSLSTFLTDQRADRETILQAARYAVAEFSDDLSAAEMRAELDESYAVEAEAAATALRSSPEELSATALAVLSWLWYDEGQAETVRQAITNAQTKMPVIEVGLIVSAVMYGLHLWRTKGVKRAFHKIETKPDGTYSETVEIEHFAPAMPFRLGRPDRADEISSSGE